MRKAFTLIELLVVIAIIAILAAILFPVFAQAKEAAKNTATLSTMKQIGTACMLYGGDYDDGYPTWSEYWYMYYVDSANKGSDTIDRYWDAKLYPYVKSGNPGQAATPGTGTANWGGVWRSAGSERPENYRSIGISMGLIYDSVRTSPYYYRYVNASQIEKPADTIFVGDGGTNGRLGRTYDQQGYFERWMCRENSPLPSGCPSAGYTRDAPWRFTDKANYAFMDGHAKTVKGDVIFPRPPKNSSGNWAFAAGIPRGNLECTHAKYMAALADQRAYHASYALSTYGVTCNP